ncbi:DUF4240 domain-containing protein [Kitasatospora sp. NPDC096147]|uniref:DUF4240 domain-containing protein n=1 Tax=Kitasatospora sp. NPDC096147 TaxID=3364093 RepID=UPI003810A01B
MNPANVPTASPEHYAPAMSWDRFWQLIDRLGVAEDGRVACAELEAACAGLTETLAEEPVEQILGFGERLAEALYTLDRAEFGTLPVAGLRTGSGAPFPQSDDSFLYSRAAVVAAGRHTYESVLGHPERFAPFTALQAEELLYVHEEAYERATGEEYDELTFHCYESCSNEAAWPDLHR